MGAPGADRPPRGPPREGERPPWFGDREGYRSSSGFGGEKGGVPGDYRPDFQSGGGRGFGRGGGGFNSRAPSAITECAFMKVICQFDTAAGFPKITQ
ncbi:hypothetical protein BDL97_15G088700 [Sphagnum fallax]|nr:hypothetical protein BDL97_15G088700 [Sphagnum fallax]